MFDRVIVIGASEYGIAALRELVRDLPASFRAPILVVLHVGDCSLGLVPRILSKAGSLPAVHPDDRDAIENGHIYIAPPDHHMLVAADRICLSDGPKQHHTRPAIDPLFCSAADAYGPAAVGVVLTGQLRDGTAGLAAIKDRGGIAIVQDPREAGAPSMPQHALDHVRVDHCCKVADIAALLTSLVA